VTDLFDMKARALRRDRAARMGPELFLYDRAFDDCLQRLSMVQRQFGRALLIGAPDPGWRDRLHIFAGEVQVREPGKLFAERAASETLVEDAWEPPEAAYDLIVTVGTLDTVNDLPLALRLIRLAMKRGGYFTAKVGTAPPLSMKVHFPSPQTARSISIRLSWTYCSGDRPSAWR